MLGIARNRVIKNAKIAFDYIYEEDMPKLQHAYEQSQENLMIIDEIIRILDISGELKWLRISAVPHREGKKLILDGFMQDVSASKITENRLEEEKQNFQNFFETLHEFMLVCDLNGNLLYTNPSVAKRLGYTREEFTSMQLPDLYPRPFHEKVRHILMQRTNIDNTVRKLPLQTKDGEQITVDMNIIQGTWGGNDALFCVARDITENARIEAALRESQQMLQLIMDTIPIGIFWKDRDSVYLGCNRTYATIHGLKSIKDVVGKTPFDIFDKDLASSLIKEDRQVLSTNRPLLNLQNTYTRTDGRTGWLEWSKIPLHDKNGHVVGVLGFLRDITEQKQADDRLRRMLEDMERFNLLMRSRERRTLELKEEVNKLLAELGKPAKYRTTSKTIS